MKSTLRNMTLSLGGLVVFAAALLAGVKILTDKPIAEAQRRARIEAFERILGPFDNNPAEAKVVLKNGATVYPATLDGSPAGAAVEVTAANGFGGPFTLLVGFDPEGTVTGYTILSHSETPGLGAKMDTWFADPVNTSRSIVGRRPQGYNDGTDARSGASRQVSQESATVHDAHSGASRQEVEAGGLAVTKDGGEIDAITGATITSRAFLGAVNAAAHDYRSFLKKNKK